MNVLSDPRGLLGLKLSTTPPAAGQPQSAVRARTAWNPATTAGVQSVKLVKKVTMPRTPLLMLTALALVAGACGAEPGAGGNQPPPIGPPAVSLDGTSWTLVGGTSDDLPLTPVEDRAPTLAVVGGQASGSTGCNTFSGPLAVAGDGTLSLGDIAVTEMACNPPAVMELEGRFLAALGRVDRFQLDGDRLTLTSGDGSAQLEFQPLTPSPDLTLDAATWLLTGFVTDDVASSVLVGTGPTLVIDPAAGTIGGNGGCNDFGAELTVDGSRLSVGQVESTAAACDEDVMQQEADYLATLRAAAGWSIDGSWLTITTDEGRALTFIAGLAEDPAATATAWIAALAAGDLDRAAKLMASASLDYVDARGGLAAFGAELTEGWGAWQQADERRVWSVGGRFADGSEATVVVLTGTVSQEGMTERRAMALLTVPEGGRHLVHPFAAPERIGFVVPRADFVDQVAPTVPFELATPEGFEVLLFLDGSAPLPGEVTAGPDRLTFTASAAPEPGEHVLTALYRSDAGELGAQAVLFTTTS